MLEIIILFKVWQRIGERVRSKGHAAFGYQILAIVSWFGGEIVGGVIAGFVTAIFVSPSVEIHNVIIIAYILAIACGAAGVWFVFQSVENLPDLTKDATPVSSGTQNIPSGAVSAAPMYMAPIPLEQGAAKPKAAPPTPSEKKEPEPKDSFRELIETVVFVVVLVLMLKTNLAEAFVIPTGSMGDTLLGYHHKIACKQCGYVSIVNASDEAEPKDGHVAQPVIEIECANCGFWNRIREKEVP